MINSKPQGSEKIRFPELSHCNIKIAQFSKKNTKHTNKQKTTGNSQEKKQKLAETIPEEAQTWTYQTKILCLLNMLKGLKETMDKALKKTRRIMHEQIDTISKEIKIIF